MAPLRPKLKTATKPTTSTLRKDDNHSDAFRTSKRDKRQIKHSAFVSKIEKPRNKKALKRRRPSKKLATSLESLADALPDADADDGPSAGSRGSGADAAGSLASQANVIRHKSLKHRPGALKRKEKLDRLERDRFGKNMAQMAAGISGGQHESSTTASSDGGGSGGGDTSARWSALRSFISQTMDQNPEFKGSRPS